MSMIFLLVLLIHSIGCYSDPFKIYWNAPSEQCSSVRPEEFQIITNKDRQFNGDKIAIFYTLGAYPYCNEKGLYGMNGEQSECVNPVNGGVPQAANLAVHLKQIELDINKIIPNETFDGLAIIDYEGWRPVYDLNYSARRVYQKYSQHLVTKQCKNCTQREIEELAKKLFENGSKLFLLKTLDRVKQLRPFAKWGFWEYPLCNANVGFSYESECSLLYRNANKQLEWLYSAVDILLPKIYFYDNQKEIIFRRYHVYATIRQTLILRHELHIVSKPIYAYAKLEYAIKTNKSSQVIDDQFYTKLDVCDSLKYPMEMGIDGVIIWSTSFKMGNRCDSIDQYLHQVLGPFSSIVVDEARKCSLTKCQGKGRCVANDLAPYHRCQLGFQPTTYCVPF